MKNFSLILRILAVIAAIAATTLFFISKGKFAELDSELKRTQGVLASTQSELGETKNTLTRTETQLKREQKTFAETEAKLDETESKLYASQQEVARTKNDLKDANTEIAELKNTTRDLRADLVTTQKELANASRQAEINQLNQRIAELELENQEIMVELESKQAIVKAMNTRNEKAAAQSQVNISTMLIPLSPDGEPIGRIRLETTVNSISPADGLIVLDTFPEFDFADGQTITLVQDLKAVGKIQIQKVEEGYAVANILPGSTGANKLRSGSKVQLLL